MNWLWRIRGRFNAARALAVVFEARAEKFFRRIKGLSS